MVDTQRPSPTDEGMLSSTFGNQRMVLYEELAEYHYLFVRKAALKNSDTHTEVRYHIHNLVLLSLYFDAVLIQTSTIFNTTDLFVRSVAMGVVGHPKFGEMAKCGVLKIVGWGGRDPASMFECAKDFALSANINSADGSYYFAISKYFMNDFVVSRNIHTPDYYTTQRFIARLNQSSIIRKPVEFKKVVAAFEKSLGYTGQLVAISFNPELEKLSLSADSVSAVEISFVESWYDNVELEIPNVFIYAPLALITFVEHKIKLKKKNIRAFLYTPQIFAAFLSGYIRSNHLSKIVDAPYAELMKIRNGDWARFSTAYHDAIAIVSDNIGYFEFADAVSPSQQIPKKWADDISGILKVKNASVDVNAFVESIAMLSGVMLTMPFLGPIFKIGGVIVGKKINQTFNSIRSDRNSAISPFINKLQRHYGLDVGFA